MVKGMEVNGRVIEVSAFSWERLSRHGLVHARGQHTSKYDMKDFALRYVGRHLH